MNRYGALAWEHWERHRPGELATIPDPTSFFRELGDLVEAEVTAETATRLSPVEATDPDTVAQVRRQVEEEILAAHVLLPDETDLPPTGERDPDVAWELTIPADPELLERLRHSPLLDPEDSDSR
jgi:hypothetical protein